MHSVDRQNLVQLVKRLRAETGMGLYEAKKAAEETDLDYDRAVVLLRERGAGRVRPGRETKFGRVETYNHNGRIGVVVEVSCETDFVANTPGFLALCREVAMQIAASTALDPEALIAEQYIRDPTKTVNDLIREYAVKCGENISVERFSRLQK